MRLEKVDVGFYRVYHGSKHFATLEKNPLYHKHPWQIEVMGGRHYSDNGGYDCFDFITAKQELRKIEEDICKR